MMGDQKAVPPGPLSSSSKKSVGPESVANQTLSMARSYDRGGSKDRNGTGRQWQQTVAPIEPLTPVQLLPSNQYLITETSPEKLKRLAGMKNNSWSPPLVQEKIPDTRQV